MPVTESRKRSNAIVGLKKKRKTVKRKSIYRKRADAIGKLFKSKYGAKGKRQRRKALLPNSEEYKELEKFRTKEMIKHLIESKHIPKQKKKEKIAELTKVFAKKTKRDSRHLRKLISEYLEFGGKNKIKISDKKKTSEVDSLSKTMKKLKLEKKKRDKKMEDLIKKMLGTDLKKELRRSKRTPKPIKRFTPEEIKPKTKRKRKTTKKKTDMKKEKGVTLKPPTFVYRRRSTVEELSEKLKRLTLQPKRKRRSSPKTKRTRENDIEDMIKKLKL